MTELKEGDIVTIIDGSQAIRLDKYEKYTSIGLNKNFFEVLYVDSYPMCTHNIGVIVHDIHIKDIETGAIYLHSSSMVK